MNGDQECIDIFILDDDVLERDEVFFLSIVAADDIITIQEPLSASIEILDDEGRYNTLIEY